MGKSTSSAPKPDPQIGQAAVMQAQTGQQWLDFAKDAFSVSQDRQADLDALTKEVTEKQLGLAENQQQYTQDMTNKQLDLAQQQQDLQKQVTDQQLEQAQWQEGVAKQDRARYEQEFQPVEDQFVQEASNYDTPEKQAEAAAEAKADVQTNAAAQKQASERAAASMGVNPASGRFAGIDRAADLGTALASAGAENNARQQVRDKGLALKADVANLGRGLPAQSAQAAAAGLAASNSAVAGSNAAAGLGINTGNSAIANMGNAANLGITANGLGLSGAQAANQQYIASTGIVNAGYGGAMSGYAGEANTLNQQYQNELAGWQAQQQVNSQNAAGIGSFLGGALGLIFGSSKKVKTDKKKLPDGAALQAVGKMPVEEWTYKPGVEDGGSHVGPYAEDFAAATGKGDGKHIAVQDAIGITMAAVQDLDRKVDRLADIVQLDKKRPKPAARKPESTKARKVETLGIAA